MSTIMFVVLAILLAMNVPIFAALSGAVIVYFIMDDIPLVTVIVREFTGLDKFALMSIPFFILTANIMGEGGISKRLIKFANSLVGFFPGGLGMTAVVACLFFGAISGSAPATVVAIGAILYPALVEKKYGEEYSIGVITSSGALGVIIPPSITMIIYGAVTGTSVGTLFVSGFGSGLLFALVFMLYSYFYAKSRKGKIVQTARPSLKQMWVSLGDTLWGIGIPVIIIGGIYGGVFTPTEAAGVSVVYSLFVAVVVYRQMNFKKLIKVLTDSAVLTSSVMIILASASVFSWVLTTSGITTDVTTGLVSYSKNPYVILFCINIAVLIAGMFLDGASIITILGPLLYPVAIKYNIDPIHLGIIICVNTAIGMFTPPFGLNLFVATGVARLPIMRVAKSVVPFIIISMISLMLITYIPDISLWLPRLIYGSW